MVRRSVEVSLLGILAVLPLLVVGLLGLLLSLFDTWYRTL